MTQLHCDTINARYDLQCGGLLQTPAGSSGLTQVQIQAIKASAVAHGWRLIGHGAWLEAHRKPLNMHDRTSKNDVDMCCHLSVRTNPHVRRCSRDESQTENMQALSLACKAGAPEGWKLMACCAAPGLRLHCWELLPRLQLRRWELAPLDLLLSWRAWKPPLRCAAS